MLHRDDVEEVDWGQSSGHSDCGNNGWSCAESHQLNYTIVGPLSAPEKSFFLYNFSVGIIHWQWNADMINYFIL